MGRDHLTPPFNIGRMVHDLGTVNMIENGRRQRHGVYIVVRGNRWEAWLTAAYHRIMALWKQGFG